MKITELTQKTRAAQLAEDRQRLNEVAPLVAAAIWAAGAGLSVADYYRLQKTQDSVWPWKWEPQAQAELTLAAGGGLAGGLAGRTLGKFAAKGIGMASRSSKQAAKKAGKEVDAAKKELDAINKAETPKVEPTISKPGTKSKFEKDAEAFSKERGYDVPDATPKVKPPPTKDELAQAAKDKLDKAIAKKNQADINVDNSKIVSQKKVGNAVGKVASIPASGGGAYLGINQYHDDPLDLVNPLSSKNSGSKNEPASAKKPSSKVKPEDKPEGNSSKVNKVKPEDKPKDYWPGGFRNLNAKE